jgi:hypothetical protein
MGPMKLYRLLRDHNTSMSNLSVALYKEEIPVSDAIDKAREALEKTLAALAFDQES